MPVTFTIKQVPDTLAARLKRRAQANRRSLQKELLSIMESAAQWNDAESTRIAEPGHARCDVHPAPAQRGKSARASGSGKLTLDQLWRRARKLGPGGAAESAVIIRHDRDGRHGH